MTIGRLFWAVVVLFLVAFFLVAASSMRSGAENSRLQSELDEMKIQSLARDLAVPSDVLYDDWDLTKLVAHVRAQAYWQHGSTVITNQWQLMSFAAPQSSQDHGWPREETANNPERIEDCLLNRGSETMWVYRTRNALSDIVNGAKEGKGAGGYLKAHPAVYQARIRPLIMRLLASAYPDYDEFFRRDCCRALLAMNDRSDELAAAAQSMVRSQRALKGEPSLVIRIFREGGWPEMADKVEKDLASLAATEAQAVKDRQSAAVFAGRAPVLDAEGHPLPPGALMRLGPPPVPLADGAVWPSGDPAVGHTTSVYHFGVSADGGCIVSSGNDGLIVWDGRTGRLVRRIGSSVSTFLLSPDGQLIAVNADTGKVPVQLFEVETGQPLWSEAQAKQVGQVLAFSPDSKSVVAREALTAVRLYEARAASPGRSFRGDREVVAATISGDGRRLAVANPYGFSVWNAQSGEWINRTAGEINIYPFIGHAFFSADARLAVSVSNGRLRFWRMPPDDRKWMVDDNAELLVRDGFRIKRVVPPQYFWPVALSPDGRLAAAGNKDGSVGIYGVASQEEVLHLAAHQGSVGAIAFMPDSKRLITGGNDHAVFIWDVGPAWEKAGPPPAADSK